MFNLKQFKHECVNLCYVMRFVLNGAWQSPKLIYIYMFIAFDSMCRSRFIGISYDRVRGHTHIKLVDDLIQPVWMRHPLITTIVKPVNYNILFALYLVCLCIFTLELSLYMCVKFYMLINICCCCCCCRCCSWLFVSSFYSSTQFLNKLSACFYE